MLGVLPQGLPQLQLTSVTLQDAVALLPAALMVALLVFTDTSVLSRALALRSGDHVNPNQEIMALGMANIGAGLFQGFPISASSSRTPVAQAAGAKTQVASVVGALAIAALLVWAPALLADLPIAVLGAVVISACLSFADFGAMVALYRLRKVECALSVVSFLGVAFVGGAPGHRHQHSAGPAGVGVERLAPALHHAGTRGRGQGLPRRQAPPRGAPGARPGCCFAWDEQLFFANAEVFRAQALHAVQNAPPPVRRIIVVADAITDVDITAADALLHLHGELQKHGVELWFAGMKGTVKDRLKHYGTLDTLGHAIFSATAGFAVNQYRQSYQVEWKDLG